MKVVTLHHVMLSISIRPCKINCMFCVRARVAFQLIKTKTHTAKSTNFPEYGTFSGLKIGPIESEKTPFKVFPCNFQSKSNFGKINNQ